MSRCFPFPPPGYEKKARPDQDANLLIKENQKDKKQKKDKKDKEKKERRDKDKEKSGEKQREKKERKHKHRDKKEKSRDKEEKKSSEERRIVCLLDHQKSEQRGQTGPQVGENQSSKLLLDLGKKVRNDNGAKEMQIVERIRVTNLSVQSSGKVLEQNDGISAERVQKFKDKREENRIPNGHYINLNAVGLANGFVSNFPAKDQKTVEGGGLQGVKVMEKQKEHKDTNKHKDSEGKGDKKDGDREKKSKSKDKKRKREKEKANGLSSSTPSKLRDSGNNAVDCSNDRGSNLSRESSLSHGNLNKRKEPDKDGVLNGVEVESNKLLRPAYVSHQVFQTGNRIDASNATNQFALEEATGQRNKSNTKNSSSISVVQNGMKLEMRQNTRNITPERQELVSNHNKSNNRLFTSTNPAFGNGRNLEPCETVRIFADMEQRVVTHPALDKKDVPLRPIENGRKLESSHNNQTVEKQGEVAKLKPSARESQPNGLLGPKLDERPLKINGVMEHKKPSGGTKCERPTSSSGPRKDIFETPVKPPHPDVKYLDEILSVPRVEWCGMDEQTWLFSREDQLANVSAMIEEPKQVWAEAMRIESADVTALPYVIPY